MKAIVKILSVIALIITLTGCRTRHSVVNVTERVLYERALKALNERQFIIEANEFYLERFDVSPVKRVLGSYISMQGNLAIIKYSADLFPKYPFELLETKDNNAKMTDIKSKRNGDVQFTIEIDDEQPWKRCRISIVLYKNTNKCFVRVKAKYRGTDNISFTGYIRPL